MIDSGRSITFVEQGEDGELIAADTRTVSISDLTGSVNIAWRQVLCSGNSNPALRANTLECPATAMQHARPLAMSVDRMPGECQK